MMNEQKDSSRFLQQIQAHQNIIHKVSFVYARTAADRDDLEQEILLQLWRSFGSFDNRSEFSTWMYRVALNTAIATRRKKRIETESGTAEAWIESTQATRVALSEELRTLYRAIAQLSAVDKAVIMQWLDDRSYEAIADTLGISVKNVSVRLVRIRERLTKLINEANPS